MDELDFASLLGDEANSHFAGISHFKVQRICDPVSSSSKNLDTESALFNDSSINKGLNCDSVAGIQHIQLDVVIYGLKVDIVQKLLGPCFSDFTIFW